MTRRARLAILVGGGVVLVVVAGVLAWRAFSPGRPPAAPADFTATAVPIDSPHLALETDEVRGVVREGRTQWRCLLRCREAEGCHAQLRVTVHYRSSGTPRSVAFADTVRVAAGEVAMVGGSQRPPEVVDAIEGLSVVVEQRLVGQRSSPIRFQ